MTAEDEDLRAFARAWREAPDGGSGTRYAEALVDAGRLDDAVEVLDAVWRLGYPVGRTERAWLEHDRGDHRAAIDLLALVLPDLDEADRPASEGVLGHWLWRDRHALHAEPHLRAGETAYAPARADLAELLCASGRRDEGLAVYRRGVAAGEPDSMLPLANLLVEDGGTAEAEALYRRAAGLGDAYSAWNLSILLAETGRQEEAEQWRWTAAQGGDELAIGYYESRADRPPAS